MDFLTDPTIWASLATLTAMEIILGIDNIVFITILAEQVPVEQRSRARLVGLAMACITRLALLSLINFLATLTAPLITLFGNDLSGRDLILLGGGLFLIYKSTKEVHAKLEGDDEEEGETKKVSFWGVIVQIMLLDIIFSLDSVITAIGMAEHLWVMMTAVILSLTVMLLVGKAIGDFVMKHPTVKMLALSFLLLIGVSLLAESLDFHIPKPYIYSAMAFSVFVEMLNLAARKRRDKKRGVPRRPVRLRRNVVGVRVREEGG